MNKSVRSKALLIERLSEIKSVCGEDWDSILPDNLESDFYSSYISQFQFFKNLRTLTIGNLSYVLRISTKTYYKILEIIKNKGVDEEDSSNRGRPPNVSADEEQALLEQLMQCQCQGDCMSPSQARIWLEEYIRQNGKEIVIDRYWWYRFKEKHKDKLNVLKVNSLESARIDVKKEDVHQLFNEFTEKIKTCGAPQLIINMDESGFVQRPLKNTTKNCICFKDCPVKPSFRDASDGNYISIVAAVTLSGRSLKSLLISTTEKPPQEVIDSCIGDEFVWFKTRKGYLNEEAMLFWLRNILLHYVHSMKPFFPAENCRPLLIFDGLKNHQTAKVKTILEENSIETLVLPPHSSHLLQCLDLCFFGIMKRSYKVSRSHLFDKEQKKARKIEKIIKAFHTASYSPIIIAGWKASGIEFTFKNGNITDII